MDKKDLIDSFCRGYYFLYKDEVVVYVGISFSNCMERIVSHYNCPDKRFDSFEITPTPKLSDKQLRSVERKNIKKHKPVHNIIHNIKSAEPLRDEVIAHRNLIKKVRKIKDSKSFKEIQSKKIEDSKGKCTKCKKRIDLKTKKRLNLSLRFKTYLSLFEVCEGSPENGRVLCVTCRNKLQYV